jgi:putative transposase
MAIGRPLTPIRLSTETREYLESIERSRALPHALVRRASIILQSASGRSNGEIANALGLCRASVGAWRQRYLRQGIAGLYDVPRPGAPRTIEDDQVAALIRRTLQTRPPDGTRWSCRTLAAKTGISKSTVHRIWRVFSLQPHRAKSFSLSSDPFFVEKVRDIVGLYLNPPENALVLCVDEKSQIQALERAQPVLPMGLGYLEGVTHNYVRHGTTTLFAALEVASGEVLTQCKPRHRHQEFLQFLNHIDASVPPELDVHLVLDNYGTHKHSKIRLWLARRPRYHVHYTPTYASWLNQVEIWFGLITRQAIRRGSFRQVKELVKSIETFVARYNPHAQPFSWTATPESILAKLRRLCTYLAGTRH